MAQTQQFLDEFQQKMDRLADIRRNLQASVQFKQQFTDELKTSLRGINDKVKQLSDLINNLKSKADNLEQQIGTNASSIGDKERQISEINQQMMNASAEKDRINQEFTQYKSTTENNLKGLYSEIDQLEAQLRDVTQQKESAENQTKALQADIQASGDQKDKEHAEQIDKIGQDNQRQLQEQEQQLTQKINDCEAKITDLQSQLQSKTDEHQQTSQQLDDHKTQTQGQVADLQKQIDELTKFNQELIQRLKTATEAINEANDELASIVESVPNAQTKQEVDSLLNQITQQLEDSILNISRAAQGQPMTNLVNIAPSGQPYDVETNFNNLMAIHANNTQTNQYTTFIRTLKRRGALQNSINKIINNAQRGDQASIQQLKEILQQNRLIVPAQHAGKRKTMKKRRKQKGGFTYKTNSKRRSITSKASRRSSTNSSRKSSR
jgi:chromosome segregation ATPase